MPKSGFRSKLFHNFVTNFRRTTRTLTSLPLSNAYTKSCADVSFMEQEMCLDQEEIIDWTKKCNHERLQGVKFESNSCFSADFCHPQHGFMPMAKSKTRTYVGISSPRAGDEDTYANCVLAIDVEDSSLVLITDTRAIKPISIECENHLQLFDFIAENAKGWKIRDNDIFKSCTYISPDYSDIYINGGDKKNIHPVLIFDTDKGGSFGIGMGTIEAGKHKPFYNAAMALTRDAFYPVPPPEDKTSNDHIRVCVNPYYAFRNEVPQKHHSMYSSLWLYKGNYVGMRLNNRPLVCYSLTSHLTHIPVRNKHYAYVEPFEETISDISEKLDWFKMIQDSEEEIFYTYVVESGSI